MQVSSVTDGVTVVLRNYTGPTNSGTIAAGTILQLISIKEATSVSPGLLPAPPNDATKVLRGDAAFGTLAYSSLSGIPASFAPSAHASTHTHGGSDPATITYSDLSGIPSTFAPSAHATSHKSGGSDAIKLDELAAPTDVTTLNVSTTAHGLCPKAPNDATQVLRGDGAFSQLAYSSLSAIPLRTTTTGTYTVPALNTTATTTITAVRASKTLGDARAEANHRQPPGPPFRR
jgi:hypothetical protein